jgi:4-hydroxybenzoate polyprenyltransferase
VSASGVKPAIEREAPVSERPAGSSPPLVIDLDGTLVATDTLFEGILSLIRKSPLSILQLLVWLSRGKAFLKSEIARRAPLTAERLPYRHNLVEYLQRERGAGRTLVLATAAHQSTANRVADFLGFFDFVLATSDSVNLRGSRKRDELVRQFGERGFDYVGDSRADAAVWEACRVGHVAGVMGGLPASILAGGTEQGLIFTAPRAGLKTWLRAMRVHQWVKNVLVFVPTLLNRHLDWNIALNLAITFLGFSFVASGSYLINDLFDLAADRHHPSKRRRPLASGQISIPQGVYMAGALLVSGMAMGIAVSPQLVLCLGAYLVLTLLYSWYLKGKPIIDVVVLALLFTVRLYTGGLVSRAFVSPWLFQFSIFLFLSLAFVKRYSELLGLQERQEERARGRNYRLEDLHIISQAGVSSGLIAGLVLAMYVNGREMNGLYAHPEMLWGMCPLFVYWIIRVWLITHRGNMHVDPVLFAFRDRVSYIVGFLIVLCMALAIVPHV